jgi:hypothetical protein
VGKRHSSTKQEPTTKGGKIGQQRSFFSALGKKEKQFIICLLICSALFFITGNPQDNSDYFIALNRKTMKWLTVV